MIRAFRLSLYFVLGLFLGGYSVFSHAFKVPLTPGAGVSGSAGIGFKTDGYQAFSSGKTMGTMQGQVSGKPFSFPAEFPLAANAASVLLMAVKTTPTLFAFGAIATWLANYDISVKDGELVKTAPNAPNVSTTTAANATCANTVNGTIYPSDSYHIYRTVSHAHLGQPVPSGISSVNYCYSGIAPAYFDALYVFPYPHPTAVPYAPVTEEDLAALKSAPLPDSVASEATQKGVKMPLDFPHVTAGPKRVVTSDPYTDPRTGQRYRDEVEITPQPSTPSEAEGRPIKRPLSADDVPDTTETGEEKAPEEETDHCKLNPDTIGCSKWGEPDDADLDTDTKNATINPDTGWGATTAACPADLTHTLKTGHTVGFKWKPLCDGATMFRPVVIGMAWLTATLIFMGIARKGHA